MPIDPAFDMTGIQRTEPLGPIPARQVVTLPLERIHPLPRLVHRFDGPLNVPRRLIYDHELVLVLSGRGDMVTDSVTTPFEPHDLLFVRPFEPHLFVARDSTPGSHIAVHFDFGTDVPHTPQGVPDRTPYEVRLPHGLEIAAKTRLPAGHRVAGAVQAILRSWDRRDPLDRMNAVQLLLFVLIELLRTAPTARGASIDATATSHRNESRVARLAEFIAANIARPLSSAELADAAQISVSRLNVLFREVTGYPLAEYVRRARIEEARSLLGATDLSIKEIAARAGFEDAYHFSKVFRQIDGLSPSQFRESALRAGPVSR